MKRILVLGATGAMGIYLVPELARRGYAVDALSLDESGPSAGMAGVTYHQCNAKDDSVLRTFFDRRHYDAIVDFMLYSTAEVEARHRMMLDNTDHYIFLSSYRVYADEEHPVRETSPRLLDVTTDEAFLARHLKEYALYKAEQEDVLRASGARNFTILRPTMVYSTYRYQLVGLEAQTFLYRAQQNKITVLPENAMSIHAAMTWSGDVARLIAGLLWKEAAMGETFTVSSGEVITWGEVAEIYQRLTGLRIMTVSPEEYAKIIAISPSDWYKHIYDRFFDRVIDNSKILSVTGMKREDFTPLREGLARELNAIRGKHIWSPNRYSDSMDAYLAGIKK